MTFSIIGRDPKTGEIGIAVASRFFAVGAMVPHVRADRAIATQAFANPMYGVEGLRRLAAGETGEAVLGDMTSRDAGSAQRQAHMLDTHGRFAAFTGADCVDWAGHAFGADCTVAGNMLIGPDVIEAMRAAFEASGNLPLTERLMAALEAGETAGGDKRGRQSAAIRVHRGQDWPHLDIRADDHADPLAELRRLLAVADERYLHFAEAMATCENFSGAPDRAGLDAAIRAAEERRRALGVDSVSFATPLA